MEATNSELLITIELIKQFYQKILVYCNSIDELRTKGTDYISEVKDKYNSDYITGEILDIYLVAVHNFIEGAGNKYNVLIMKGGGIKGLSYVGALEELDKYYKFNWYAGSSAGAITAILLGCGYSVKELGEILNKKNFKDFKDASILRALYNFITKSGLYEAESFNVWLEDLLAQKLNSSVSVEMRDLKLRTTVFASRKDKNVEVFDSHKLDSQNRIAAFAARCSMSIPYIFTAQKIDGRNILDGGIKNNFPVELILNEEKEADFIGLYLGKRTYKHEKSSVLFDLFSIWAESNEPEILRKYRDKIIIIDPSPISTLNFKLNNDEKEFLLENGRLAALDFLHNKNLFDKETVHYSRRLEILEKNRKKLNLERKIEWLLFKDSIIFIIILLILNFL